MNFYDAIYNKLAGRLQGGGTLLPTLGAVVLTAASKVMLRLAFLRSRLNGRSSAPVKSAEELLERLDHIHPKTVYRPEDRLRLDGTTEKDLSVIVPCYNVSEFIEECIESILRQDTRYALELILVNDGSTDDTEDVIRRYLNDPRVVYLEQENSGSGHARNQGLCKAKGLYVMFVDSDDYLLPGAVETLMGAAVQEHLDIVEGGYRFLLDSGKCTPARYLHKQNFTTDLSQHRDMALKLEGVLWMKVFRRSLWEGLMIPENNIFEDTVTRLSVLRRTTGYRHIDTPVYVYRKRAGTVSSYAKRNLRGLDAVYVIEYILNLNQDVSLAADGVFYQMLLLQMSKYLYPRIKNAPDDVLIPVLQWSHTILDRVVGRPSRLAFPYDLMERCILQEDLKTWKIVSRFC